jgi:hypothetical protein
MIASQLIFNRLNKEVCMNRKRIVKLMRRPVREKKLAETKNPGKLIAAWQQLQGQGGKTEQRKLIRDRMEKTLSHFGKSRQIPELAEFWREAEAAEELRPLIEERLMVLLKAWRVPKIDDLPQWFIDFAIGRKPIPSVLVDEIYRIRNAIIKHR